MTPPIRTTGNPHLTFTAPPMGETRRQHVHGALVPMERPKGEPPLWLGALIVLAVFAVIGILGVLM